MDLVLVGSQPRKAASCTTFVEKKLNVCYEHVVNKSPEMSTGKSL